LEDAEVQGLEMATVMPISFAIPKTATGYAVEPYSTASMFLKHWSPSFSRCAPTAYGEEIQKA